MEVRSNIPMTEHGKKLIVSIVYGSYIYSEAITMVTEERARQSTPWRMVGRCGVTFL